MRERLEPMARLLGCVFAAVVLLELVHALVGANPLRGVTIPEMPKLAAEPVKTNSRPTKAELPPPVKSRVTRVVESEILGPFMRPLPVALLGIAGEDAFLRAADGQTGLAREGDSVGGLKLLRIGTNRVLVEQDGVKKELTVFGGMGGEPLLPPETNLVRTNKKESHHETKK